MAILDTVLEPRTKLSKTCHEYMISIFMSCESDMLNHISVWKTFEVSNMESTFVSVNIDTSHADKTRLCIILFDALAQDITRSHEKVDDQKL